jgi:hypothetical protein
MINLLKGIWDLITLYVIFMQKLTILVVANINLRSIVVEKTVNVNIANLDP